MFNLIYDMIRQKRLFKQIFKKNYYLAKAQYKLHFLFTDLASKEPIIIYQMGKVGSSTILRSLRALDIDTPIFHTHTLTVEGRAHGEAIFGHKPQSYFPRSKHLLESEYLCKEIERSLKRKIGKWKVVTLVRDPIARNISSFWRNRSIVF